VAILERRIRIGVTGISDAGKTVFITALVHSLLNSRYLAHFSVVAEGRLRGAILRPQPSQDVPRFPYEDCVAAISAQQWPAPTRYMAELRISLRYRPKGLRGRLGDRILNVDLFDYPGEWLLDLALLNTNFTQWSAQILDESQRADVIDDARPWLDFVRSHDADRPDDATETIAIEAARLFTTYLRRRRERTGRSTVLGPGRFLLPGQLEGSPLLTFCPLPVSAANARTARNSLRTLLVKRFQHYKRQIVQPFHQRYFAKLDRQVVLVDLASHFAKGRQELSAVSTAMDAVLGSMRVGSRGWLPRLLRPRIDRVLIAASKADHVPASQHPNLEALLKRTLSDSVRRTAFSGATLETMSLAALRATRETEAHGERYVAGRTESGKAIAHFPGLVDPSGRAGDGFQIETFLPPADLDADGPWPHIRMDRAIESLIGDWVE